MTEWLRRTQAYLRRGRLDEDLAEEIRQHLDRRRDQLIEDGMDPGRAAAEARRSFGNVAAIREDTRDMWSVRWIDALAQDVRYGARLLSRAPGFTGVAVLSLAAGIGCAATVFNVADAALFRPLAVKAPHELRQFHAALSLGAGQKLIESVPETSLRDMQPAADFGALIGFRVVEDVALRAAGDGASHTVRAELVTGNYFAVLGVSSRAGRLLGPIDDGRGVPALVVSERLWRSVLGGDPAIVGRTVTVNGNQVVVAGVVRNFRGLISDRPSDLFVPLAASGLVEPASPAPSVRVVARLHPQVSPDVAGQKMTALFQGAAPAMWKGDDLRVDLRDASLGVSDVRDTLGQPLILGLAFAGVLLLVACANTGGLLLARLASRRGEFAVRVAIGAGRARLMRQLVIEALLIAAMAAAAGLLIAAWTGPLLLRSIPIGTVAAGFDLRFDWRLILFTAATSAAAALLAAGASLFRLLRSDPSDMLVAESRAVVPGRRRLTHALIGAQVACSLLLLVGAGSMTRSLLNLAAVDPGFETADRFALTVDATGRAADPEALRAYFGRLHERIASAPHVARATLLQFPLMSGAATTGTVDVPGFTPATDDDRWVRMFFVGPQFFETVGMRIIAGDALAPHDSARGARVAVVNREFARFYFGGPGHAVGRIINGDIRVAGVVADARYRTLRDPAVRAVFVPYGQVRPRASMTFIVHGTGDETRAIASAVAAVRTHDPQLRPKVAALDDLLAATLSRERFVAGLSAGLSGLAVFLACAGLYGTISFAVSERRSELAVRLALGASPRDIVGLMLREPVRVAAAGVAAGVPAAYIVMRALSSMLFGVSPFDAWTLLACTGGLMAVATAAALWPARRAAAVDPLECLKCR